MSKDESVEIWLNGSENKRKLIMNLVMVYAAMSPGIDYVTRDKDGVPEVITIWWRDTP